MNLLCIRKKKTTYFAENLCYTGNFHKKLLRFLQVNVVYGQPLLLSRAVPLSSLQCITSRERGLLELELPKPFQASILIFRMQLATMEFPIFHGMWNACCCQLAATTDHHRMATVGQPGQSGPALGSCSLADLGFPPSQIPFPPTVDPNHIWHSPRQNQFPTLAGPPERIVGALGLTPVNFCEIIFAYYAYGSTGHHVQSGSPANFQKSDSVQSGRTCLANLGVRSFPVRKLICPVRQSPKLNPKSKLFSIYVHTQVC